MLCQVYFVCQFVHCLSALSVQDYGCVGPQIYFCVELGNVWNWPYAYMVSDEVTSCRTFSFLACWQRKVAKMHVLLFSVCARKCVYGILMSGNFTNICWLIYEILMSGNFTNICWLIPVLVKSHTIRTDTMKTAYVRFCANCACNLPSIY